MKYRALDGYEIEARDYSELTEKLWKSMFIPDATIEEWMINSERCAGIYSECMCAEKIMIRSDTVQHHIEDLINTVLSAGWEITGKIDLLCWRIKANTSQV